MSITKIYASQDWVEELTEEKINELNEDLSLDINQNTTSIEVLNTKLKDNLKEATNESILALFN